MIGGALGFNTAVRPYVTRIANSTEGSKNLGIGIDPSDANSWPLRSPGILSRRVPVRISPAQAEALGPAIKLDAEP